MLENVFDYNILYARRKAKELEADFPELADEFEKTAKEGEANRDRWIEANKKLDLQIEQKLEEFKQDCDANVDKFIDKLSSMKSPAAIRIAQRMQEQKEI